MNSTTVAKHLRDLTNPKGSHYIEWKPDGKEIPNIDWLTQVYTYFTDIKELPINELNQVPLVPCSDGLLYTGETGITPLWYGTSTSRETLDTLKYFEIPLIEAQQSLQRAINAFRNRHPDKVILGLTVPNLIDRLHARSELPVYNLDFYKKLVNFLADRAWIQGDGKTDEPRKENLRQLQIYSTVEGQLTDLQNELRNIYIPGGYLPPNVAGSLKLLCLGANEASSEWKPFYDFLNVPVLDHAKMIEHLLKDYGSLDSTQQLSALEWIHDHLNKAQSDLTKQNQTVNVKKLVREANLIRCTDGQLRAISAIYTPRKYKEVWQVLGDWLTDTNPFLEPEKHIQTEFQIRKQERA